MAKKIFDERDLAAVQRVLNGGHLSYMGGKASQEFEAQAAARFGCAHAIALHSAMAGLQNALMAVGVGEADEVICDSVVPFGAYAVLYCRGRPVFADIDPATHNIEPASIRARLTPRTKAIVVTHLWGLPAPMDEVMAIAREHNLPVIEDCAHALFAEYDGRLVGTIGTVGVFSLQQSKHMTTGEGGLLLTNDSYVAAEIRAMLGFGSLPPRLSWNFRMNELTAAVAAVQFARADRYVEEDRRSARLYEQIAQRSRTVAPQRVDGKSTHSYHIWTATYAGERTLGRDQATLERLCVEEGARVSFGYLKGLPLYLHPSFALGILTQVWDGARFTPYRRGYCPSAEDFLPRRIGITISTEGYAFHEQNAAAFERALQRLEG